MPTLICIHVDIILQYGDIKTVRWLVGLIYTLYSVFNVTIILDYMAAYILCFCPVWPAIALMYTGYTVRTVQNLGQ